MTLRSYFFASISGTGMHWNFDTHKGFQWKIRSAFGIDRWLDHIWKGFSFWLWRYRNRFAGVNQLGVVFWSNISSLSKYLLLNFFIDAYALITYFLISGVTTPSLHNGRLKAWYFSFCSYSFINSIFVITNLFVHFLWRYGHGFYHFHKHIT
jgi:hypothetical protein